MNLKLTIEGSASQLALVLAALDGGNLTVTGAGPVITMTPPAPVPTVPLTVPLMPPIASPTAAGHLAPDDEGTANTAPPQMDASGLPWDERIHAGTKALTDDGMWRKRRGVAKQTVEAVEAQLRAVPVAAPMPIVPPLAAAPVMPTVAPLPVMPPPLAAMPSISMAAPPMPVMAPAPVVPPMPVAPAPEPEPVAVAAPQPVANSTLDFAQFMQHLSGKMAQAAAGGDATRADFTAYLTSMTAEIAGAFNVSLGAITDIAANPQMIVYASQLMQRDGRW